MWCVVVVCVFFGVSGLELTKSVSHRIVLVRGKYNNEAYMYCISKLHTLFRCFNNPRG